MALAARLPGIKFEVVPQPVEEAFVRMDIAVFVGFCADGPLHTPKPVESIPEFEKAFGGDLIMATDKDSKQPAYACLPSAVRAFFRNGGRRCYVVRVGGAPDGSAELTAGLFLDQDLRRVSSADLLAEAEYIQYQSSSPRSLTGIHAALGVDEATIICVPDAVQPGWQPSTAHTLSSPPESSPLQHPEWWHFLDCLKQPEIPRVRELPAGQFHSCDLEPVPAPLLSVSPVVNGTYTLTWDIRHDSVVYLEEAVDPAFTSAAVIYAGRTESKTFYGRRPGAYYYRARREVGTSSSDYSDGLVVQVETAAGWETLPASTFPTATMLEIHTALLRMCAARGDLFAVLALPSHFRDAEAIQYAAQLQNAIEPDALSFGALYHPWQIGREETDVAELRSNPPDGAMAGIMAERSAKRGAWISPANEPLHGVVSLTPSFAKGAADCLALQKAQINPLRQEPGGFMCLSGFTLSSDVDLQWINVRRLLSFLRKEAQRAGDYYVFEPNSDEFRRAVQRGFEKLLDRLLQHGALAGRVAEEAYQVVVENRLNAALAERGQFVVELRVAPSVPLRFMTIRLLQTAERTFITEGR